MNSYILPYIGGYFGGEVSTSYRVQHPNDTKSCGAVLQFFKANTTFALIADGGSGAMLSLTPPS